MSLIIGKKIRSLIKGYPTVSDKYNVVSGTLTGDTSVNFGELVTYDTASGTYKAIVENLTAVTDIAGIVLATNVKLALTYPASSASVSTEPGEAFNLFTDGYIAVELDSTAVADDIAPNKAVAVFLDVAKKQGKLTTTGVADSDDVPGWTFTGIYENIGTDEAPIYVAEIRVK